MMSEVLDPHSSSAAQAPPAASVATTKTSFSSLGPHTPEYQRDGYKPFGRSRSNSPPVGDYDIATHPGDSFGFETSCEEPETKDHSSNQSKSALMSDESSSEDENEKEIEWAQPYQPKNTEESCATPDFILKAPYADDPEDFPDLNPHLPSVNVIQLSGPVERRVYNSYGRYLGSVWEDGFPRVEEVIGPLNPSMVALYGSPESVVFDCSDSISELSLNDNVSNQVEVDEMSDYALDDEMTFGNEDKDAWVLHMKELREAAYAAQRFSKSDMSSEHSDSTVSDKEVNVETMYHLAAVPKGVDANVDLTKPDTEIWHQGMPKAPQPFKHHRFAIAEWRYNPAQEHWPGLDMPKPLWYGQKWWYQGWEKVGLVQYV